MAQCCPLWSQPRRTATLLGDDPQGLGAQGADSQDAACLEGGDAAMLMGADTTLPTSLTSAQFFHSPRTPRWRGVTSES